MTIDRKLLADLAVNDAAAFGLIAEQAKAKLPAELTLPAEASHGASAA